MDFTLIIVKSIKYGLSKFQKIKRDYNVLIMKKLDLYQIQFLKVFFKTDFLKKS